MTQSVVILFFLFFFFNDTATTEIYTLSLHDALPISCSPGPKDCSASPSRKNADGCHGAVIYLFRSEEHTSELQSQSNLVCRLLLEKKKKQPTSYAYCTNIRCTARHASPCVQRRSTSQ